MDGSIESWWYQITVELAQMAGVDITTDEPLKDTIAYIGSLIDELESLTEEINQNA